MVLREKRVLEPLDPYIHDNYYYIIYMVQMYNKYLMTAWNSGFLSLRNVDCSNRG